ncbi:hypothetical protein H1235_17240 [Pseudoxanthomonas sp. NC8]|nr:hypothetical protein H1235_17240 [Pseudoxanthomonas sp. NC8]
MATAVVVLTLAHVDQSDQDRGDDGVSDQHDAVVGRVAVLERGFHDELPGRGERAGLLEDLRDLRRTRVRLRRLAHGLRLFCRRRRFGLPGLLRLRVAHAVRQRRHQDRNGGAARARAGQPFLVQGGLQLR